jgi:hypothetical protein
MHQFTQLAYGPTGRLVIVTELHSVRSRYETEHYYSSVKLPLHAEKAELNVGLHDA